MPSEKAITCRHPCRMRCENAAWDLGFVPPLELDPSCTELRNEHSVLLFRNSQDYFLKSSLVLGLDSFRNCDKSPPAQYLIER